MSEIDFNTSLAKNLQRLKKDLGAKTIRQGYKGTGGRSARRQIWVELEHRSIDIWLEPDRVSLGGVSYPGFGKVPLRIGTILVVDLTVEQAYQAILEKLRPLAVLGKPD